MLDLHLIDYRACHDYAAERAYRLNIPRGEWHDIGSDAFLLSVRRAWRATPDGNPQAFANRLMFTAVVDVIRRRNRRANAVCLDAAPVVEPDANDDSPDDEPLPAGIVVGDGGSGAESARAFEEDWENPLWLRLFESERQRLRNERKASPLADLSLRLVRAGLRDSRLRLARDSLHVSGRRFQTVLDFLKMRFTPCHQALREFRRAGRSPTFRCDNRL